MTIGHIYVIDLRSTRPSFIAKLQEFLNIFSERGGGAKTGWAVQAQGDGRLEFAIRDGKLDSELHSYFFLRCKVREMHLSQGKSMLMFPDEDNVNAETDPVKPGDPPRDEAQKVTDPGLIESLKEQMGGKK